MNFKIFDGRGSFYQWDLNQKLIVDGITLNDEIHFKNIDGTGALVVKPYSSGENILVDVPNVLLQKANSITVWVYVNNDHTKEQAVFNVIPRQKPADYIYTPTEVSVWKVLEEAVENIPNEYAKKNHVHSQYLTAETDPSVEDWAKKGSEYEITGNPVTLENIEHMPMNVITTLAPIQTGSGDPSPSNIRIISGWKGAKLTRCGKNLLPDCGNNSATANGITLTCKDGVYKIEGTATTNTTVTLPLSEMMTVPTGTYIHLGNPVADASLILTLRHTSGTVTNILFSAVNRIASTADFAGKTIQAISVQVGSGKTVNFTFAPMIKLDSAATAYAPYHGNAYTADFGQTVYGGTFDWQTGVLTVDRAIFTLTGEDGAKMTGTSGVRPQVFGFDNSLGILKPANSSLVADALSSHFKIVSWNELTSGSMFDAFAIHANGSIGFAYNGTISEANAWLSAQYTAGTPVQVCYKLATPTTIQLTPQEIEALQGTNTLYGDGSLNVSGSKDVYWLSKNLVERIKTLESAIISLGGNV